MSVSALCFDGSVASDEIRYRHLQCSSLSAGRPFPAFLIGLRFLFRLVPLTLQIQQHVVTPFCGPLVLQAFPGLAYL